MGKTSQMNARPARTIAGGLAGFFIASAAAGFVLPALAAAEPTPVKKEAPEYPRGAQARGIEGAVTLGFSVDENGNVVSPHVVDATPPGVFDSAAIQALSKWKFTPVKADNLQVKLTFKLQ